MSVRSLRTLSEPTGKYTAIMNDNARSVYSLIHTGVEFDYINFLNALTNKKLNVAYEIWKQHIHKGGEQWLLPKEIGLNTTSSPQCLFASVCDAKLVQLWVNQNLQAVMDKLLFENKEDDALFDLNILSGAEVVTKMEEYLPLLPQMVNFRNFEGVSEMIRLITLKLSNEASGNSTLDITSYSYEIKFGLAVVLISYGWLDALFKLEQTDSIISTWRDDSGMEMILDFLFYTAMSTNNLLIMEWFRLKYPSIQEHLRKGWYGIPDTSSPLITKYLNDFTI